MATRSTGHRVGSTWIAIVAVVALAAGVGILAALAVERGERAVPEGTAAPVPTFALGVQTPSPTPSATPTPEARPRQSERFLAVGPGAMWRATAGACAKEGPLLERSVDGGAMWTDVTPRYRGAAQVASLDVFEGSEAGIVAGVGGGCDTQALRTYTEGEFWDSYPDVLAQSRYVDVFDAAVVHTRTGRVAAPCPDAHGLRATGPVVALVCDGTAYVLSPDNAWLPLPGTDAAAVAISSGDLWSAHTAEDCTGLAITRFDGADPAAGTRVTCAAADSAGPIALAAVGDALWLWAGDAVSRIG
ncbi:hypothetical protein [Microbacterium ulmi]|uniref:Uncharacterized protein n=1 Tax=Microbacterium ulmi TaxID=179095 RepID=A0A7Y2M0T3_9MICO|nr:hypothetical protein [Microbacterium ulmi]NII70163.1 hypothetical protein [Microbacterium ulmi]NNH04297.1 hypothetical protein [Microbacterium ulmi]